MVAACSMTWRRMLRNARHAADGRAGAADIGQVQQQRQVTLAAEGHGFEQFDRLGPPLATVGDAIVGGAVWQRTQVAHEMIREEGLDHADIVGRGVPGQQAEVHAQAAQRFGTVRVVGVVR
jgi:hypothetical protein